jgi:hypothetical protein
MLVVDEVVLGATIRGASTFGSILGDDRHGEAITRRRKSAW